MLIRPAGARLPDKYQFIANVRTNNLFTDEKERFRALISASACSVQVSGLLQISLNLNRFRFDEKSCAQKALCNIRIFQTIVRFTPLSGGNNA